MLKEKLTEKKRYNRTPVENTQNLTFNEFLFKNFNQLISDPDFAKTKQTATLDMPGTLDLWSANNLLAIQLPEAALVAVPALAIPWTSEVDLKAEPNF